jgi:hypothetical protein
MSQHDQMLLDMSRDSISKLTKELNNELSKITLPITEQDKTTILNNCGTALASINSKLEQLKNTVLR